MKPWQFAPQAYLPKFGGQTTFSPKCLHPGWFLDFRQKVDVRCLHLTSAIIQCPGKLLLPALQSEMDWMRTLSQPKQGNQRVLSPGRWFPLDLSLLQSWPGDPAADTSGNRFARSHPGPGGGCTTFFPSFSSLVSASFPLSRRETVGCSVPLSPPSSPAFSSASASLLLSLLSDQFTTFNRGGSTSSSCPFSPTPLLSFTASLWLLKCSSPLSRQERGFVLRGGLGEGGWHGALHSFLMPLGGFYPCWVSSFKFWTHRLVFCTCRPFEC